MTPREYRNNLAVDKLHRKQARQAELARQNTFEAVMHIEDGDGTIEDWQSLIDSGIVWQLQGSYGRAARDLIHAGDCVDTHGVLRFGHAGD